MWPAGTLISVGIPRPPLWLWLIYVNWLIEWDLFTIKENMLTQWLIFTWSSSSLLLRVKCCFEHLRKMLISNTYIDTYIDLLNVSITASTTRYTFTTNFKERTLYEWHNNWYEFLLLYFIFVSKRLSSNSLSSILYTYWDYYFDYIGCFIIWENNMDEWDYKFLDVIILFLNYFNLK